MFQTIVTPNTFDDEGELREHYRAMAPDKRIQIAAIWAQTLHDGEARGDTITITPNADALECMRRSLEIMREVIAEEADKKAEGADSKADA